MKNLKKKEMNEKLKKIRETTGIGENEVCLLDEHDLEEEFDPDEYDKKTKQSPDKKKKRKISEVEKEVINKELEEYYKLDYEDTIGDLKTRFKYRPVKKNNYGLKAKDILVMDDKELNQLILLKKLATYREDEFIVPRYKIKEQKQRIKSLVKGETSEGVNNGRKMSVEKSSHVGDDVENETTDNEDGKVLSRKQIRKKKLSEFTLPLSRLFAYQKFTAKSSNKRKHKA